MRKVPALIGQVGARVHSVIVRSPPSEAGSAIPFDAVLLLAGQVQVSFPPMVVAIAQVKAGKLRALAVTTAIRSEAFTPHDGSLRAALSTGDDDGALPGSRCDTC